MRCVQKVNAMTCVVWRQHALALVIWKKYDPTLGM